MVAFAEGPFSRPSASSGLCAAVLTGGSGSTLWSVQADRSNGRLALASQKLLRGAGREGGGLFIGAIFFLIV
jgi:hypothetical protein